MKPIILFISLFFCCLVSIAQTSSFITLGSANKLDKVTITNGTCNTISLNLCSNIGTARSIALDGNILYIVNTTGDLYSNTLTTTGTVGNCTLLGKFAQTSNAYFGMTVGPNGIVYAAIASDIETYNPITNQFAVLGTLPNGWTIGGDLLFYQNKLYEAATASGSNILVEVNLTNVAASTLYMTFNAGSNVFGFASVTIPCANNQAFAISNNGTSTDIFEVDMQAKTQATTKTCNLPFRVNDAASIAETQTLTPTYNDTLKLKSCDSVKYNTTWYKTTITFLDTLKSSLGCDSVFRKVDIKIGEKTSSTFLKDTSGSYTWNGVTYTQSGTYTKTGLFNSSGCDSSIILVLKILLNPCWISISGGQGHSVAIKQDGSLWSWGSSEFGQVGNGNNFNVNPNPQQIGTDTNWLNAAGGLWHTAAIKKDGTLWSWGADASFGTIGNGTIFQNYLVPIKIGLSNDWAKVEAGGWNTVALKNDGSLWIWGDNGYGQLGIGNKVPKNIPTRVGNDNDWIKVSCERNNTAAIKLDGSLWICGDNSAGQIGDGTFLNKTILTQLGQTNNWSDISVGTGHTIAIKKDGTLWAWGYNFYGQLGDGTNTNKNTPTQIGTSNMWKSISARYYYTVALKKDGTLWAWGYNQSGDLGDGTTIDRNVPTKIGNDVDWDLLTNGEAHTLGVKNNGSFWSWGFNGYGNLGNGTTNPKHVPTLIISACNPCPTPTTNTQTFNSCQPYIYNGNTYTTSTILKDTIKTKDLKCDSIYNIININVTIAKNDTLNLFDCDSVFYKGVWYYSSTSFYDTTKSKITYCDSLQLLVNIKLKANKKEYAYITNEASKSLSVIDAESFQKLYSVNVGEQPHGVVVSNNGNSVYITDRTNNKVYIFNPNTKTIIDSINTGTNPLSVCITPNNQFLYVSNYNDNTVSVLDVASKSLITTINVGSTPLDVVISKDGKLVYVSSESGSNVSVISTVTNAIINTIGAGSIYAQGLYLSSNDSLLFVVHNIDMVSIYDCKNGFANVGQIFLGYNAGTIDIVVNEKLKKLYASNSNTNDVSVVDLTTNAPIKKIPVGSKPYGIDINEDGSLVFVANRNSNTVSVINTTTDNVVSTINVDNTPMAFGKFFGKKKIEASRDKLNLFNCDSVVYKTRVYKNSISFIDTFRNLIGCDSLYILVNIKISKANLGAKFINSCGAYTYNGKTYHSSITIKDTLKNTIGCDSIYNIININITIAKNDTLKLISCDSVFYNNKYYSFNHYLFDTIKNTFGCDSLLRVVEIVINNKNDYAYITNDPLSNVTVVQVHTQKVVATINVGNAPDAITTNKKGTRVYVLNLLDSSISVINTKSNTVINTIKLNTSPHSISIHPNDSFLYVANFNSNTISIVNLFLNSVVATISGFNAPSVIEIHPNGKVAYVSNSQSSTISVIDLKSNTIVNTIAVGTNPYGLSINNNGNLLYVANTNSNSVSIINTTTNNVINNIPLGIQVNEIKISPNNKTIAVTHLGTNKVTLINALTNTIFKVVTVGSSPTAISYSTNGEFVLIPNGLTNDMSVIEVSTGNVIKTISGFSSPSPFGNFIINVLDTVVINNFTLSNCSKIVYKGITYSNSTLVKDTTKNIWGCDSLINIAKIIIKPIATKNDTTTITHCKQVIVNGINYFNSQVIKKDTIKNIDGCDSIYNFIKINIQPIVTKNDTTTITHCKEVAINGVLYNISTVIKKDTIRNIAGCDSVFRFINIIIKPISIITNIKKHTSCKSVTLSNGNIYRTSTIVRDTIKSYQKCDSIYLIDTININKIIPNINKKDSSSCDSVRFRGNIYFNSYTITDTFKNNEGCDTMYFKSNIIIHPKPTVIETKTFYALPNSTIILKPTYTNDASYMWLPNVYLDNNKAPYPYCTPLKNINYKVTVYNALGCSDTATVKVIAATEVIVPTAFSPNGDNINDSWVLKNIEAYKRNNVKVFDRFGRLVHDRSNYMQWNGKNKGLDMPTGVYYYIITLDPSIPILSGYVTIFR